MTPFLLRKLLSILFLMLFASSAFAQESMLAYKFAVGQKTRYKLTSNTLHEGGMFSGGRLETNVELYYTISVTEADREGTATVTFTQDSVLYWENKERLPYEAGEPLNGVPMSMWFSNRGIVVDVSFPEGISRESEEYLDGLIKDFASEPPLPGQATGVGAEWRNDLTVYFIYADGMVKMANPVKSKYARKENVRGRDCARIEYSGSLASSGRKVGAVSGTIHHALREGRILRVSSKTEAILYAEVRGGRAQMRISNTQTREALN